MWWCDDWWLMIADDDDDDDDDDDQSTHTMYRVLGLGGVQQNESYNHESWNSWN